MGRPNGAMDGGGEVFLQERTCLAPRPPPAALDLIHKQELRANGICLLVVRMTHGELNYLLGRECRCVTWIAMIGDTAKT